MDQSVVAAVWAHVRGTFIVTAI